jgi:hypothetical protein
MIEKGLTPPPLEQAKHPATLEECLRRGVIVVFLGIGLGIGYFVLLHSWGPPDWICGAGSFWELATLCISPLPKSPRRNAHKTPAAFPFLDKHFPERSRDCFRGRNAGIQCRSRFRSLSVRVCGSKAVKSPALRNLYYFGDGTHLFLIFFPHDCLDFVSPIRKLELYSG